MKNRRWFFVLPISILSCIVLYLLFVVIPPYIYDETSYTYDRDIIVNETIFNIFCGFLFPFIGYKSAPKFKAEVGIVFSLAFILFVLFAYNYITNFWLIKTTGSLKKGILLYGSLCSFFGLVIINFSRLKKEYEQRQLQKAIKKLNLKMKEIELRSQKNEKPKMSRGFRISLQAFKNVEDKKKLATTSLTSSDPKPRMTRMERLKLQAFKNVQERKPNNK